MYKAKQTNRAFHTLAFLHILPWREDYNTRGSTEAQEEQTNFFPGKPHTSRQVEMSSFKIKGRLAGAVSCQLTDSNSPAK